MAETKTETDNQTNSTDLEIIQPFVIRWNRLISTTNWDKGEVIQAWRTALEKADAAAGEYLSLIHI